jgi:hypothetical protein
VRLRGVASLHQAQPLHSTVQLHNGRVGFDRLLMALQTLGIPAATKAAAKVVVSRPGNKAVGTLPHACYVCRWHAQR